jgi:hypothetical protein
VLFWVPPAAETRRHRSGGAGGGEEAAASATSTIGTPTTTMSSIRKSSARCLRKLGCQHNDEITLESSILGPIPVWELYGNFNDWDANNNEVLNQEEFNEGIQVMVSSRVDADNNNVIAENEFNDMSTQV